MKIAIGADWTGFEHKKDLVDFLRKLGNDVIDMGGDSSATNDYPDFAKKVSQAVARGQVDLGILMCGTGLGMSIAANKVHGIRAALCHDAFTTKRSRSHNNANILVMGAWVVSIPHARELVELWLTTEFEGGRHIPRLEKIHEIEETGNIIPIPFSKDPPV
jgi:ribose 5-phosphate isomerase B